MQTALLLLIADARFPAGGYAHSGGIEQAVDDGIVRDRATLEEFLAGRLETVGRLEAHAAALAWAAGDTALDGALDSELDARMPSPASREASRAQGAAFDAACRAVLGEGGGATTAGSYRAGPVGGQGPGTVGEPRGAGPRPHLAVAIGSGARRAGLDAAQAALVACYQSIAGPASAALRLLGLDPLAVTACLARLGPACDTIAGSAATAAGGGLTAGKAPAAAGSAPAAAGSAPAAAGSAAAAAGSAAITTNEASGRALPAMAAPLLDVLAERHRGRTERLFAS